MSTEHDIAAAAAEGFASSSRRQDQIERVVDKIRTDLYEGNGDSLKSMIYRHEKEIAEMDARRKAQINWIMGIVAAILVWLVTHNGK